MSKLQRYILCLLCPHSYWLVCRRRVFFFFFVFFWHLMQHNSFSNFYRQIQVFSFFGAAECYALNPLPFTFRKRLGFWFIWLVGGGGSIRCLAICISDMCHYRTTRCQRIHFWPRAYSLCTALFPLFCVGYLRISGVVFAIHLKRCLEKSAAYFQS